METTGTPPNKKEVFELWMEGDHVLVHLDATRENVIVPSNLKSNSALTLKLSHLFQGRTTCSEEGVNTYLKFSGDYFECIIPWDAIFGITSESGEQKIWPASMQTTVLKKITDTITQKISKVVSNPNPTGEVSKADRKRPNLQRIK